VKYVSGWTTIYYLITIESAPQRQSFMITHRISLLWMTDIRMWQLWKSKNTWAIKRIALSHTKQIISFYMIKHWFLVIHSLILSGNLIQQQTLYRVFCHSHYRYVVATLLTCPEFCTLFVSYTRSSSFSVFQEMCTVVPLYVTDLNCYSKTRLKYWHNLNALNTSLKLLQ
jgi:hypothetical protein